MVCWGSGGRQVGRVKVRAKMEGQSSAVGWKRGEVKETASSLGGDWR